MQSTAYTFKITQWVSPILPWPFITLFSYIVIVLCFCLFCFCYVLIWFLLSLYCQSITYCLFVSDIVCYTLLQNWVAPRAYENFVFAFTAVLSFVYYQDPFSNCQTDWYIFSSQFLNCELALATYHHCGLPFQNHCFRIGNYKGHFYYITFIHCSTTWLYA